MSPAYRLWGWRSQVLRSCRKRLAAQGPPGTGRSPWEENVGMGMAQALGWARWGRTLHPSALSALTSVQCLRKGSAVHFLVCNVCCVKGEGHYWATWKQGLGGPGFKAWL